MRLALFTNEFPGKVTTFVSRDVRALIDAGIDVEVFAIRPYDPDLWRFVPRILDERSLPRDRVHHAGPMDWVRQPPRNLRQPLVFCAEAVRILTASVGHGVEITTKSAYVLPQAWSWAQQYADRFDHVLSYWGNYAGTCAYMFHRLAGRPIPFSTFLHANIDLYSNKAFLRQKLLYADNIITVCEFNRGYLREHLPDIFERIRDRIHVHHLGLAVDGMEFRANGHRPRRLIAVGRLTEQKGYDDLIRALGELHRRGVDASLDLVGEGHLDGPLRQLAAAQDVTERVNFRGWLDFEGVQQAMRESAVLVHPSPSEGDAVPTVIKEALALGTPVIGTRMVGIPELLDQGNCGVLVPPRDPVALAGAIADLLRDDERRKALAVRGRAFAERTFDMWSNGRRLAGLLRETRRGEHHR